MQWLIRLAVRLCLCFGFLLLVSPFLISSFLIDQRGVVIPGHVRSKDERIVVKGTSWTHILEVTVEYDPPQDSTVGFMTARVNPDRFDELKKNDPVQLHYLRREDTPHLPGASTLRQMHMLPFVRMADQRALSEFQLASDRPSIVPWKSIAALVLGLIFWRVLRIPLFGWAVAASVLFAIVVANINDYPIPLPAPQNGVRRASATVKSIERLEYLFRDNHSSGFEAEQPIQVVGVQFVPGGRTEPVVAVDLIDAGSVAGLQEHAPVEIEYEAGAPRTAHIRGARREFARRNLNGIAVQLLACLIVLVVFLVAASLLGKGYRRLTNRKAT